MQTQRLLIALTGANLALFAWSLVHPHPAGGESVAPVLRGQALEIVDDHGRVRASLSVLPADPKVKMPETVLFRLINSKGRPCVKVEATEIGAAMGLVGETDPTNVLIDSRGAHASLTVTDKDGRQQALQP